MAVRSWKGASEHAADSVCGGRCILDLTFPYTALGRLALDYSQVLS